VATKSWSIEELQAMSARPKYLFDVDFSTDQPVRKTEITLAAHQAALAEARAQAYAQGFAAAEAKAKLEAERRAAAALERVGSGLETLNQQLAAVEARMETEAVEVAVAVSRKLAPQLIANEPLTEIVALASQCFTYAAGAPHIVVRINDALHAEASQLLEAQARAHGFEGRLVVLAAPSIAPGDARIEWADGGVVRDRAAIETAINEAVERYLAVRRAGYIG